MTLLAVFKKKKMWSRFPERAEKLEDAPNLVSKIGGGSPEREEDSHTIGLSDRSGGFLSSKCRIRR